MVVSSDRSLSWRSLRGRVPLKGSFWFFFFFFLISLIWLAGSSHIRDVGKGTGPNVAGETWDAAGKLPPARSRSLTGSGQGGWWSGSVHSPFGWAAAAVPGSAAGWPGPRRSGGRAGARPCPGAAQAGAGSPLQNTGHVGLMQTTAVTWALSSLLLTRNPILLQEAG